MSSVHSKLQDFLIGSVTSLENASLREFMVFAMTATEEPAKQLCPAGIYLSSEHEVIGQAPIVACHLSNFRYIRAARIKNLKTKIESSKNKTYGTNFHLNEQLVTLKEEQILIKGCLWNILQRHFSDKQYSKCNFAITENWKVLAVSSPHSDTN